MLDTCTSTCPRWHDPAKLFGTRGGTFACGGAGTLLSRAAMLDTDFKSCGQRFAQGCFQSDWMIGKCVEQAGVAPSMKLSCGLCANACKKSMHNLLHRVHEKLTLKECMFGQFEAEVIRSCNVTSPREFSLGWQVCGLGPTSLAVAHGFPVSPSLTNCKATVGVRQQVSSQKRVKLARRPRSG